VREVGGVDQFGAALTPPLSRRERAQSPRVRVASEKTYPCEGFRGGWSGGKENPTVLHAALIPNRTPILAVIAPPLQDAALVVDEDRLTAAVGRAGWDLAVR
jgi:hypothetical protein